MKQVLFFASVFTLAIVVGCGTKPGEAQANESVANPTINVNQLSTNPTPATTTTQQIKAPDVSVPVNLPMPTQSTTTTQNQVITTSAPVVTPQPTVKTAPGMNPPHGQPGHRCDIAVGAPLNSPVTKSPSVTPTTQNQVITTSAPVVISQSTVKTAPGMNPPHGQPGHRCDIAVGAPLNSKPAVATTPSVIPNTIPGNLTPSIVSTSPATVKTKTAPGMNPPHGEPGHRCEIAVGAPLNSKPEPLKVIPTTPEVPKSEVKKDN